MNLLMGYRARFPIVAFNWSSFLCLPLFLSLLASNVSAHNVVSGVYADGMIIEGEIGYSNGDMAESGNPVKVFNESDELIAELVLNDSGAFLYEAKTATKHVFKANLSAGHVAEMIVEGNELHLPMGQAKTLAAKPIEAKALIETANKVNAEKAEELTVLDGNITVEQLESIIRSAVAQQIRPLQKELKAYKEKVMLRDIAGGLGFIFGIFGVAAWASSRRKQGGSDASVS